MTTDARVYGAKYNRDLDIAEIAKALRADIKAGIANGELPKGLETSVRIRRYSGGQSLDVTVTACPAFRCVNPEWALATFEPTHPNFRSHEHRARYTAEAESLLTRLNTMREAYNHDGSDLMADHFDVNFYGNVTLRRDDSEVEEICQEWQADAGSRAARALETALASGDGGHEPDLAPIQFPAGQTVTLRVVR